MNLTSKNCYRSGFLLVAISLITALGMFSTIANAQTFDKAAQEAYVKNLTKAPETMACSPHSTAILSYAEQLKDYNNNVRLQLAEQGVGLPAKPSSDVTPEMIVAYANGDRSMFNDNQKYLPGAETAVANGIVVPKQLTSSDPQTMNYTLDALMGDAISKAGDNRVDSDGLPTAYEGFFNLNTRMREQWQQAKQMNLLGVTGTSADPSRVLLAIEQKNREKQAGGFLATAFNQEETGGGAINQIIVSIKRIFTR